MLDAAGDGEYVVIGQDKHVVARSEGMYFPLEQRVHTVAASAIEYVPAKHLAHVAFAGAATTDDALPAGQFEHAPAPFDPLYCPAHASTSEWASHTPVGHSRDITSRARGTRSTCPSRTRVAFETYAVIRDVARRSR
jgi:hypothetical protein